MSGLSTERVRAPLPRGWWVPLALVILALVALATTPVLIGARVRRLRRDVIDVVDPAELLINDEEAALAMQMLALGEIAQGARAGAQRYADAMRSERSDEASLEPLVRQLGPDAIEQFAALRDRADQWHADVAWMLADSTRRPMTAAAHVAEATDVLARADTLERSLGRLGVMRRAQVRALERWDVRLPALLVPFALVAALVVFWMTRRMRQLARDAEAGREAAARTLESRAALMRGVSHDLKNPLGAALGYAELLADDIPGTLNDRQREIVLRLRHLITAAVDTITDLLELSRAEAGRLPLRFDPTDVAALARETLEDYRAAAAAAGLTVECIVAEPLEPIATDSSRVRQIVGNLLSNAIKYTPAPGRVVLTVARSDRRASDTRGEWLLISVADSGPGIPPAYRERVFEEFVRVPSGEDHARGAGVGLAISRRVARLLGGELTLASGAAGGAIFTLRLPIHRPGRVAGAVIAEAASPGGAADAAIDVQADGA